MNYPSTRQVLIPHDKPNWIGGDSLNSSRWVEEVSKSRQGCTLVALGCTGESAPGPVPRIYMDSPAQIPAFIGRFKFYTH